MKLEIHEVQDKEVWESFLQSQAPGALFQSWLWGDVQKKMGIPVWRYGVYEGGRLIGIAQIIKVSAKRGWFLHVRHGPIIATQNNAVWRFAIQWLKAFAQQEQCWFVRINPLIADSIEHRALMVLLGLKSAAIHAMDGEYCWVLDLDRSLDELLAGMRKTTRYEIRKSEKLLVEVSRSNDPKGLRDFLSLYAKTFQRHEFVPHKGIGEEFEIFGKSGRAQLYLARHEGEILAGAIVLWYGNQAIYHHGASVSTRVPASYAIQWQAIIDAKKRGIKLYNFWGIAPDNKPNHPWRGITLFKKGFGGRIVEYIHTQDLPVSVWYPWSRAIEAVRRIRKGY